MPDIICFICATVSALSVEVTSTVPLPSGLTLTRVVEEMQPERHRATLGTPQRAA